MANKTREDALKTRQLVIDTAIAVIKENGYDRATLLHIAERAKLSRGAVYGNFKNKAELFSCILQNWKLPEDLTHELTSCPHDLAQLCGIFLEKLEEDGLYRIIYSLATSKPQADEEQNFPMDDVKNAYRKILGLFEALLAEGQKKGDISKKQNISQASAVLLSYLIGLGKIWSVEQSSFSLHEWAFGFIEIFLRGLKED